MSAGKQIPLGQAIPDSLHAVSVSIPTMDDVIGYEEKRPATLEALQAGYPRFLLHKCLKEIEAHWQRLFAKANHRFWLTSSESMALRLQAHLQPRPSKLIKHRGVSGLCIPSDPQTDAAAKLFLQHVGGFLSSRQAEDYLITEGLRSSGQAEERFAGDSQSKVLSYLQPLLGNPQDPIQLCNCGMNAFYAAFEAVKTVQQDRGRRSWVKLGWLYTDTMHILDKLSGNDASNIEALDVFDLDQLETLLNERGSEIAGIVTEAPTNPLIQTMDLQRIRELATQHEAYLIVDPTVASPLNVDVSKYADIIVNSLTKYAANYGDTLAGAIAVSDTCPKREGISRLIGKNLEPLYQGDLHRLAYQIDGYRPLIEKSNANAAKVIAYLEAQPEVERVFWSKSPESAVHYEKLARNPAAIGSMVSFQLNEELAPFYDAITLCKGPSFGMVQTLICPYVYLAHYELVTSAEGQQRLAQAGISPELLRLSVGAEPIEQILSALESGFAALRKASTC